MHVSDTPQSHWQDPNTYCYQRWDDPTPSCNDCCHCHFTWQLSRSRTARVHTEKHLSIWSIFFSKLLYRNSSYISVTLRRYAYILTQDRCNLLKICLKNGTLPRVLNKPLAGSPKTSTTRCLSPGRHRLRKGLQNPVWDHWNAIIAKSSIEIN